MYFYVNFRGEQNCSVEVNYDRADVAVLVPIRDIATMIDDICDDLDMVRPQDMEALKYAIDRFNYLTKVEN